MSKDVLIIGGGFAGLAAGVALARAGWRVRLLEQKPHLGGRARSFVEASTGMVVDNGQHIFMGCYHATIKFLDEIGTLDRIRFQQRLTVQFLEGRGRHTALRCPDLPAPWHLLVGVLRSASFGSREKLEVIRLGRALESGRASRNGLEGLTVDEWLSRLGQSEKLRRNFWDLLCIAAMNEDPRIASAVLFERVLRLALFTSAADSRLGLAQVGLSDCYTDAAGDYIRARGGQVETGRRVASFLISGRAELGPPAGRTVDGREADTQRAPLPEIGLCEGVRLMDGENIEAQTVLSAVPWFELARLLPGDLLRSEPFFGSILTLRPAPIISINLWFDRPVTDLDFVGLRGTTVQWLFNKSVILKPHSLSSSDSGPRTQNSGLYYISLVLSGAHDHIARPKEELLEVALRELAELLPVVREAKLVHSLVLKERFATFSPSYDAEQVRPPARTPVKGLYLAGDWTATGLPATIEGAVQSGYTAAQEILETPGKV